MKCRMDTMFPEVTAAACLMEPGCFSPPKRSMPNASEKNSPKQKQQSIFRNGENEHLLNIRHSP